MKLSKNQYFAAVRQVFETSDFCNCVTEIWLFLWEFLDLSYHLFDYWISFFVFQITVNELLNWLCQYLSFLNIFFNRFSLMEKCGITPHCLYRDSLTLKWKTKNKLQSWISILKQSVHGITILFFGLFFKFSIKRNWNIILTFWISFFNKLKNKETALWLHGLVFAMSIVN